VRYSHLKRFAFVVVSFTLVGSIGAAEDFFDSVDVDLDRVAEPVSEDGGTISYRGYLQLMGKYGLDVPDSAYAFERDQRGLGRLRSDAFVEFRGALNPQLQWQMSAKAELDWYRWEQGEAEWALHRQQLRLKDAYFDLSYDNGVWLRAGHQVLAWGESEGLAITDVLSPVDSRAPGQAQLQDSREHIPAIMLSTPIAGAKLSWVLSYRAGADRLAEEDEEFYPYIALKGSGVALEHRNPESVFEYAIRWERQLNGGDITLMAADVNDNAYAIEHINLEPSTAKIVFGQQRVQVLGGTANRALGDWLLRAELAHYWGQAVELAPQYTWGEQNQWRSMVGVEYSGINDLSFSYEINSIFAPETLSLTAEASQGANSGISIGTPQWQLGHVMRIRHTALNERWVNQFWALALTTDPTRIYRWDSSYSLSDTWELALAAIVYENADRASALYPFRNQDTVNLSATFNF